MTHDPFQTYQAWGVNNPLGYAALQGSAFNPTAAFHPLAATFGIPPTGQFGYPGISNYGLGLGIHPQQLIQSLLASQGVNPFTQGQSPYGGMQNQVTQQGQSPYAGLQNPLLASLLQNPLAQSAYQNTQNPMINPVLAQQGFYPGSLPYAPYQQLAQQGLPLAPQSWVGPAGPINAVSPYAFQHPLAQQLGARPFPTPGTTPWGYF